MSDKSFQHSLTALTGVVLIAVIAIIVTGILHFVGAIAAGLIIEAVGGGVLLNFWGKNYMARV